MVEKQSLQQMVLRQLDIQMKSVEFGSLFYNTCKDQGFRFFGVFFLLLLFFFFLRT